MVDDEARKKANELFKRYMAEESGKSGAKGDVAAARAQGLLGVDLSGGNFCDKAPGIVDMLQREIRNFSFLIPDQYETPAKVFLRVIEEAVLPVFCGTASGSETATATRTAVRPATPMGGAQKRS